MSVTKNISLTITNETEGISMVIKTVSTLDNGIVVSGDPGLYHLEDIKAAIKEVEAFITPKPPEETS